MIYSNVLQTIGHTPIIQLNKCVPKNDHKFFAKVEFFNPGGSVKDRIALSIIEDAEKSGKLKPGGTIIEATSGNTGVGLAMVAAIKGYKCIFVMPEKISEEKRATLRAYGARVVITPMGVEPDDPRSFYSVAKKFVETTPNSFHANQYHNPANVLAHYEHTGPEIWEQMEGKIDVFVGGIGTGGTLSGVGRYLKEKNPEIKIVCADPIGSILYDLFYYKEVREKPQAYLVEGIGEDMLPDNVHFNVVDEIIRVADPEIFRKTREISQTEGILAGPSSAAALMGAIKFAESGKLKKSARILALFPDGGRSYLTKVFNEEWMKEKNLLPSLLVDFKVSDLLKRQPQRAATPSLQVNASIKEAIRTAKDHGITALPVFTGKDFVGVLDIADLLHVLANGKLRSDETVLHIVKSSLPEVAPDCTLFDLEKVLLRDPFVRVKESGTMISRADLAEFLSENK